MILNNKESFYSMFYILDEVYQNENSDDLGAILGIMNSRAFSWLWDCGSAIYDDWEEFIKNKLVNGNNLIKSCWKIYKRICEWLWIRYKSLNENIKN